MHSLLSHAVRGTRVVLGGGCSEMLMSRAVEKTARRAKGKKVIAVKAFAPFIAADFDDSR